MNSSLAKAGHPSYSRRQADRGFEPHGERLGEILGGMGLGVPRAEVLHEAPAAGPRPVGVRIRERGRPEHLAPAAAAAHSIGRVDGMPGLVAQDTHQPVAIAALHLAHEAPFEPREPPMRQVERDRDTGDAVRGEPLLREPAMGSKADAARGELIVEPFRSLARAPCPRWSASGRRSAGSGADRRRASPRHSERTRGARADVPAIMRFSTYGRCLRRSYGPWRRF